MFCKFCGREIPAGGVCDCEGSRRALAGQQPGPQPGPAPQPFNQAPQPGPAPQQFNQAPQPGPAPQQFNQGPQMYGQPQPKPAGSSVVGDTFKTLGDFFKAPGSAMMNAYTGKSSVKAAIGTGIVYAIVLLISLLIPFASMAGFGRGIGFAFLFTALIAGVRMGMAAMIAGFGKKNGASFSRVLGATCVGSIPVIGLMLIGGLLLLASQNVGMVFIIIAVVVVVGVYAKMFGAVMTGDPNKLYWMSFGVTAIYALVIYILYILASKWVVASALSAALGSLGSLFSMF